MAVSDAADTVNLMVGIRSGFCNMSLSSLKTGDKGID